MTTTYLVCCGLNEAAAYSKSLLFSCDEVWNWIHYFWVQRPWTDFSSIRCCRLWQHKSSPWYRRPPADGGGGGCAAMTGRKKRRRSGSSNTQAKRIAKEKITKYYKLLNFYHQFSTAFLSDKTGKFPVAGFPLDAFCKLLLLPTTNPFFLSLWSLSLLIFVW